MRHFICEGTIVRTINAIDKGTVLCVGDGIAVVHFANRWSVIPTNELIVMSYEEVE